MKNILVPTDFSAVARNAEEYAVALAQSLNAKVQLLHVHQEMIPTAAGPEPRSMSVSDTHAENEKRINKEAEYLHNKYAIDVQARVEHGSKSSIFRNAVKDTDLMVMGMEHKKQNKLLGGTIEKAIRTTQVPLLVVPEGAIFTSIKNITLAVDFTQMLRGEYFDLLHNIYRKFNSSLHVLHIQPRGAEVKAIELPEKLQLGVVLSRFTYQYDLIESDNVDESISNYVESHPTDLLILIAHHHNILERMFGTVHTSSLLYKAKLPVLLIGH